MKSADKILKEELLRERGYMCEHCYSRYATDQHHCLIGRDVRFPQLNCKENYMMVCHECHMEGLVDSREVKDRFWQTQCKRYGSTHMDLWLANLPLKIKPRYHA